jgi:hypothetical protein
MLRKYMIPVLALIGVLFAMWMVRQGSRPVIHAEPVADPPRVEFANRISGAGIVEASTRNISVGAHPGHRRAGHVQVASASGPAAPFSPSTTAPGAPTSRARDAGAGGGGQPPESSAQLEIAEKVKDPRRSARRTSTSADSPSRRPRPAGQCRGGGQGGAGRPDLLTVRAPVDGAVLQVNIRPGEYAASG